MKFKPKTKKTPGSKERCGAFPFNTVYRSYWAAICFVMAIFCNKFDDEIEEYVNFLPPVTDSQTEKEYE